MANKGVKQSGGAIEEAELELRPAMALLTTLIPVLLSCAVFASIKLITMDLPETNLGAPPPKEQPQVLGLAIAITDEGLVLGASEAVLPTTFTTERHLYDYKNEAQELKSFYVDINKQNKLKPVVSPYDGTKMTLFNRSEIELTVVTRETEADTGNPVFAVYHKIGGVMVERGGKIIDRLNDGDTLYSLSLSKPIMYVVKNRSDFELKKLSAYDQLASRLLRIKSTYYQMPDADEVKITAEDEVVFDKLIHVMDICRDFGFPKISLAKMAM
jgi:biopolymer transport protein ExbD